MHSHIFHSTPTVIDIHCIATRSKTMSKTMLKCMIDSRYARIYHWWKNPVAAESTRIYYIINDCP